MITDQKAVDGILDEFRVLEKRFNEAMAAQNTAGIAEIKKAGVAIEKTSGEIKEIGKLLVRLCNRLLVGV